MPRRHFVWSNEQGCLVEKDSHENTRDHSELLWNDRSYHGLRATDGTDIGSRTKHREYMRLNNLTTIDDFKETWKEAADRRADYFTGKRGTITREDIARTIHQLENKK